VESEISPRLPFGDISGGKISGRVAQPWSEPEDDNERTAVERAKAMIERLRQMQPKAKNGRNNEN